MEELTKVLISLTKEENYKINMFLAEMRKQRMKKDFNTKAKELVRLAMIGLLHESRQLDN